MASTQDTLINGVLATVALCAVVATGTVVRARLADRPAPHPSIGPRVVEDWQQYAASGQRMGATKPSVTIVEFADFQCPYCRVAWRQLDSLRHRYPTEIQVVFKHFPLDQSHPLARPAAIAAECAARQGRFEQYHDILFEHQDSLATSNWMTVAKAAGVPELDRFAKCVGDGSESVVNIAHGMSDGRKLGITGTPALLVNEQFLEGVQGFLLDSLVRAAIEKAHRASDGRSD